MGLTIRFLGTSAARPIPRWGCTCPQCTAARSDPRARRTRSAILVNGSLLVDAGPDIYAQLARLPYQDLSQIDHVVLTHPHADHFLGLDDLASLRRISALNTLPIYALADGWDRIWDVFRYLIAAEVSEYDRRPFARRELVLGQSLSVADGLSVTPLDTHHTQPFTTAGLLIEQGDRRVVYAPDFYDLPVDRIAGADLLILDGAFLARERMDGRYRPQLEEGQGRHRPMLESVEWAAQIGAGRILFTHFGHIGRSPEQLDALLPAGFDLAYDGQVVTLETKS
ncbi:MAG: MBL fold metallo-hydrolase [Anaerolineae bacterium]|jgi:phosphoribosyl 1,2-cyclic phosphate phosphodiesterase